MANYSAVFSLSQTMFVYDLLSLMAPLKLAIALLLDLVNLDSVVANPRKTGLFRA